MSAISVIFKDARLFGKLDLVGSHCKAEDARDITDAVEDCFNQGFKTLYVYSSIPDSEVYVPWFYANFDATVDSDKTIYIYSEEN